MMSYKSTQVNVELISSPSPRISPRIRYKTSRGSIGRADSRADPQNVSNHKPSSFSLATSEFTSDRQRESFNAIISGRDLPDHTNPTIEHKICGWMVAFIVVMILVILSVGQLTTWEHSSFIEVPDSGDPDSGNDTKIYNSSFTVTCSWHKMYKQSHIPPAPEISYSFGELCRRNVESSCALQWSGIVFLSQCCSPWHCC